MRPEDFAVPEYRPIETTRLPSVTKSSGTVAKLSKSRLRGSKSPATTASTPCINAAKVRRALRLGPFDSGIEKPQRAMQVAFGEQSIEVLDHG
jgi:hypothetical protein